MKRIIYTLVLLLCVSTTWSQQLWGVTRGGWDATTPDGLGDRYVCEPVLFNTSLTVPMGESFIRRDWYYNNALYQSNGPSGLTIPMKNEGVNNVVYCVFYFRRADNTTYSVTSNTASVRCNSVGVSIDAPGQASYGCTTPITLAISEFDSQLGSVKIEKPQVPYTVSWQLPAGWSIQSSSSGNKSIVAVPDKYSGGTVRATVTLECGFSTQITHSISRPVPVPAFTAFPSPLCGAGNYTYSIAPVCGASSYTFTSSNNNLSFNNSSNTITTTTPNCVMENTALYNIIVDLEVKANFDNGTSTETITKPIQVGKTTYLTLNPYTWDCYSDYVFVSVKNPHLYPYLDWYRVDNGEYVGSGTSISLPRDGFFYNVQTSNECGISTARVRVNGGACPISFSISPNPVSSNLRVVMPAASVATAKSASSEINFKLYNVNTTALVKTWKVKAGEKEYNFNVAGLPKGQYVIYAEGPAGKGSQRIVIE